MNRLIDRLPMLVTILVAVAAGTLAAVNTSTMAVRTHAVGNATCAWLVPLIIEGGALTAGLCAWRRSRASLGSWPERLMLVATLALAIATNACHALDVAPRALGVTLAASAPVILLCSVELLMRSRHAAETVDERAAQAEAQRISRAQRARNAPVRIAAGAHDAQAVVRTMSLEKPVQDAQRGEHGPRTRGMSKADALPQVRAMLATNPGLTGAQVAQIHGVSVATANRWLAEVRAASEAESASTSV